jgi:SAM-dependent methyltransferase
MTDHSTYSEQWFDTFAAPVPDERIVADCDALARLFPVDRFPRLLELGCGLGRHAHDLTARGYRVTAIEQNATSVESAKLQTSPADIRHMDMRSLSDMTERFDGAYLLWHSFGYFDDATNANVAAALCDRLTAHARLVVDLYNPPWAESHQGTQQRGDVVTFQSVDAKRQHVEIRYPNGEVDAVGWALYSPHDFEALMAPYGFALTRVGVWWDFDRAPTSDDARFQLVLDRGPS